MNVRRFAWSDGFGTSPKITRGLYRTLYQIEHPAHRPIYWAGRRLLGQERNHGQSLLSDTRDNARHRRSFLRPDYGPEFPCAMAIFEPATVTALELVPPFRGQGAAEDRVAVDKRSVARWAKQLRGGLFGRIRRLISPTGPTRFCVLGHHRECPQSNVRLS